MVARSTSTVVHSTNPRSLKYVAVYFKTKTYMNINYNAKNNKWYSNVCYSNNNINVYVIRLAALTVQLPEAEGCSHHGGSHPHVFPSQDFLYIELVTSVICLKEKWSKEIEYEDFSFSSKTSTFYLGFCSEKVRKLTITCFAFIRKSSLYCTSKF